MVFHGDSITEQAHYTNYVEAGVLARYPNLKVEFYNVGWGGDTTWGTTGWDEAGGSSDVRIKRDIAPLRPTVVSLMFGMNDGGYVPYDPKVADTFRLWYGKVLGWLKELAPGVRFTLNLTSPWDDTTRPPSFPGDAKHPGGYNEVLLRYGEVVHDLAKEHDATFADLNRPLVAAMGRAKDRDVALAQQIVPDWIHPSAAGGVLMAAEILKAWGMPSLVSAVRLDAGRSRVLGAVNARVSGFDGTSWTQTDASLPFPLDIDDKTLMLAVDSSDLVPALDQQLLTIQGLRGRRYRLQIDDKDVGLFTDQDLAGGINLADHRTPMLSQARDLLQLTIKKNRAFFVKWRDVEIPFASLKGAGRASAAVEALRRDLCARQRATAKPRPHRFRLVPA
ncbi:MAG: hypothetical protein KIS66_07035 [Fimbriimonadaceae bacterium]|nr:hypothetical protein [Fimbriimonadaceae bacterium]